MNKFSIKDHMSKKLEDKASEAIANELNRIESGGLGDAPVKTGKIDRSKMSDAEKFSFAAHDLRDSARLGFKGYSYWRSTLNTFFHRKVAVAFNNVCPIGIYIYSAIATRTGKAKRCVFLSQWKCYE